MDTILAIRPFVPAKDFERSKRFYRALGFRQTHEDSSIAMMKLGPCSFILQNFYNEALAGNLMLQLLVRDVSAWWTQAEPARHAEDFGAKPPKPPAMQDWGLLVGFMFDPSGVLWHVAEVPF